MRTTPVIGAVHEYQTDAFAARSADCRVLSGLERRVEVGVAGA